jgi:hypothetical protein
MYVVVVVEEVGLVVALLVEAPTRRRGMANDILPQFSPFLLLLRIVLVFSSDRLELIFWFWWLFIVILQISREIFRGERN